jgi:hypothetical protein
MNHFETEKSPCTNCGSLNGMASGRVQPTPGSFTVCLYCHHLMVYGEGMVLRELTDDEMREIAGDPSLLNVMRIAEEYKRDLARSQNPPERRE